jgi:hypothetical protein
MNVNHPAVHVLEDEQWRDVHFFNDGVRCTRYEIRWTGATLEEQLRNVGGGIKAVLKEAFDEGVPIRVPGGRWSLSTISKPTGAMLDLSNYRRLGKVPDAWLATAAAPPVVPVLIGAGITINVINRELAAQGLALQTSGASDGQTLAGAIATGTHGADLRVGALHDTVLALHLVVSPTESVLIQPQGGLLNQQAADTLASWFGMGCQLRSDDQLFRAAQVHLGSLGVVLNVVLGTVPLYYWSRHRIPHQDGAAWRAVLRTREPHNANGLHFQDPDYLQFIVNPYSPEPSSDPRAWCTSMRKLAYTHQPEVQTTVTDAALRSDLAAFLPAIIRVFESHADAWLDSAVRAITSMQLREFYGTQPVHDAALPGVMFGPPERFGLDFDPLRGASAEYVFNAEQARQAVDIILETLKSQMDANRQYFGGIGIRFVKGSSAWLAPNAKPTSTFVELQSISTTELPAIHAAISAALTQANIPYGGHWGQWELNTPEVARNWWGDHAIESWKAARTDLLSAAAREVFASPILEVAGLV